jgi:hypothetical protein
MNFEGTSMDQDPKAEEAFTIGEIVYEKSTGHSYRVQGFAPGGKVVAIREKTEGEKGESDKHIESGEAIDEDSREFVASDLQKGSAAPFTIKDLEAEAAHEAIEGWKGKKSA